jgi:phosphatidylglycerol:prolipoprotein diacylglycerol transferase
VQAYAALAFLLIAFVLVRLLPRRRRQGDIAGLWLIAVGATVYFTEFWRDPVGRGPVLHGALDWPQLVAVALVLAGAAILRERKGVTNISGRARQREDEAAEVSHD